MSYSSQAGSSILLQWLYYGNTVPRRVVNWSDGFWLLLLSPPKQETRPETRSCNSDLQTWPCFSNHSGRFPGSDAAKKHQEINGTRHCLSLLVHSCQQGSQDAQNRYPDDRPKTLIFDGPSNRPRFHCVPNVKMSKRLLD